MTSRSAAVSRCCATRSPSRSSCAARSAANDVSGCGPEPGAAGLLRDAGEQRAAEPVVLQQPVPVRAEDDARVGALTRPVEQQRVAGPHHAPVVDLVAAHRVRPSAVPTGFGQHLVRRELDLQVEQPEPVGRSAPRPRAGPRSAARASGSRRRSRAPAAPPSRARHRVGQPGAAQPRRGPRRSPSSRAARRGPRPRPATAR